MSEHRQSFWTHYVFSTDHKMIGRQFLFTSMVFLLLGGALAMAIRWQLGWPWQEMPFGLGQALFPENAGQMTPEFYTMLPTMHATIMIFFVIIPVLTGAFGNFLIPLMIGADDMAFPRLNMYSYWFMWPAMFCILAGFWAEGGAAAAGWTSYPPLSTIPEAAPGSGAGQTYWLLAVTFVGLSSLLGSINYVTTIVTMRAKGLGFLRMPLTVWALFITAILQVFALPILTAAGLLQIMDRTLSTGFFNPVGIEVNGVVIATGGGQPLMWQHLFWFYSHPAVYVMVLPAMGMVSDILSTFSRKPIFGYKPMVYSIAAISGLGFIVWGHHMFMSGMNPALGMAFMTSTMFIAMPSAVKVFNWLATLWRGNLHFTSPMLYAMGFVSMFIIGGLSGIFMAATPVDVFIHDTYIIVAHFHYVVFGGTLIGVFGAIYYWYPKMFGRMMSEKLGRIHFALTFIFTNCVFYPMHVLGHAGMPRRYADPYHFESFKDLLGMNQFISISAFLLGAAQLIFIWNFFSHLRGPKDDDPNPWKANTLEWTAPSPPPHGNFLEPPVVHRGAYEFSVPGMDEDYLLQTAPPTDEDG